MSHSKQEKLTPIILSGGLGSRLWPLSNENTPKQYHCLENPQTQLLAQTLLRVTNDNQYTAPIIIASVQHRQLIEQILDKLNITPQCLILEPCPRGTAAAIALAAHVLEGQNKSHNKTMLVMPSDHVIENEDEFHAKAQLAYHAAQNDQLITFGITPTRPETGFGYIQFDHTPNNNVHGIIKFTEKPPLTIAQQYCQSQDYLWNSGMFTFTPECYLSQLKTHAPDIAQKCKLSYDQAKIDGNVLIPAATIFHQINSQSIDYAIMEHTDKSAVIPMACGWQDIGTWQSLWHAKDNDEHGNVITGAHTVLDTKNSIIHNTNSATIATLGLDNMVIVATPDNILITTMDQSQNISRLKKTS